MARLTGGPPPPLMEICDGLPEVTRSGEQHVGFVVRGRRFAWFVDDHHGDGRVALHCKAAAGVAAALVAEDPQRYFIPPYLGAKGWLGAWLDVDAPDWARIEGLLVDAYRLVAPKRLANELD
jgi:hypothetical protein